MLYKNPIILLKCYSIIFASSPLPYMTPALITGFHNYGQLHYLNMPALIVLIKRPSCRMLNSLYTHLLIRLRALASTLINHTAFLQMCENRIPFVTILSASFIPLLYGACRSFFNKLYFSRLWYFTNGYSIILFYNWLTFPYVNFYKNILCIIQLKFCLHDSIVHNHFAYFFHNLKRNIFFTFDSSYNQGSFYSVFNNLHLYSIIIYIIYL
jgi:hypothetical protein